MKAHFITGSDIVVDGGLIRGVQWSTQQASLKARNDALRKLSAKM